MEMLKWWTGPVPVDGAEEHAAYSRGVIATAGVRAHKAAGKKTQTKQKKTLDFSSSLFC